MNRILVIDDDPLVLQIVTHTLTRAGLAVEMAENGRAGMALARCRPPALILCDIRMDGGDGFTALAELRGDPRTQSIPFVLMSAQANTCAEAKGRSLGADDYLKKPFSVAQLLQIVTRHRLTGA